MRRFALTLCSMMTLVAAIAAQPKPGDYLTGALSNPGLLAVDSTTGAITTVAITATSRDFVNWMAMDFDNENIVALNCQPATLVRVTPAGAVSTIAQVSTKCGTGVALDEDGGYVVTTTDSSASSEVLNVTGSGAITTIARPNFANNVSLDTTTGDYLVALWNASFQQGYLTRVDRNTGAVTTIAQSAGPMGRVSSVDYAPRTDQYVVSSFGPSQIFILDAANRVSSFAALGHDHAVKVDDATGIIHAAGFRGIAQFDTAGNRIRTVVPGTSNWTSLEIYGSSHVSGAGLARVGQTYQFFFSFPVSGPGTPYVAVLSLTGAQPGINVGGGRVINIVPDDLLILMTQIGDIPGITQGFRGQLGPTSLAIGTLKLPTGTPSGLRVFCTAVALNPAMPAGIETGNTWAVTVQ